MEVREPMHRKLKIASYFLAVMLAGGPGFEAVFAIAS